MDQHSEHKSIQELAASVKGHVDELSNGTLSLVEIEAVVDEMRDLYERLVVVRHGAYLEKGKEKTEKGSTYAEASVDEKVEDVPIEPPNDEFLSQEPESPTLFKLDTEQAIESSVAENQTSLIDQIEELDNGNGEESLAEKMEHNPIGDLRKAIGLNQKFWFIKELFNHDSEAYEAALDQFEKAESLDAAQTWFDASIKSSLPDEHDVGAVEKFMELLERRFLTNA